LKPTVLAALTVLALAGCAGPSKPPIVIPTGPLGDAGNILTTSPPPAPKLTPAGNFGDGTHRVLTDVQPGIYRTGGSTISDIPLCSWKLLAGNRAVATGSASGPVSIVVEPSYTAVESHGCRDWQRVGDTP
jgi:hypothetical protein